MLQGEVSAQVLATPIIGLLKSSSLKTIARSIERLGACCGPAVISLLRKLSDRFPGCCSDITTSLSILILQKLFQVFRSPRNLLFPLGNVSLSSELLCNFKYKFATSSVTHRGMRSSKW